MLQKLDKQGYKILKRNQLDTPLGSMITIGDEEALYFLDFVDTHRLEQKIERLGTEANAVIIPGMAASIKSIEAELNSYFDKTLKKFETSVRLFGSPFQQRVWEELMNIPYGETRSYLDQARLVGSPKACRAVGSANGSNKLAIVIPCHRIINNNGNLGGYGGGIARKKWLLHHEGL